MDSKTITKSILFWRIFPYGQLVLIAFGISLIFIDYYVDFGFIIFGFPAILGGSVSAIIRTFDIIDSFDKLRKQEKRLGFKFNQEMKKNSVTAMKFESQDWYLYVRNFRHPFKRVIFIALKREYVKSLGAKEIIKRESLGTYYGINFSDFWTYRGLTAKIRIYFVTGSWHEVIAPERERIIGALQAWYQRRDPQSQLQPKRKMMSRKKRKK